MLSAARSASDSSGVSSARKCTNVAAWFGLVESALRISRAVYASRDATGSYRCARPADSRRSQPFLCSLSITVSTVV